MPYAVWLGEAEQVAEFAQCVPAIKACQAIIDELFFACDDGGVPQLDYRRLPNIVSTERACPFSAPAYFRQRVREVTGDLWNDADSRGDHAFTERVETNLAAAEILERVRALREPRTFGEIVRMADGTSWRFHPAEGKVEVTVVLPRNQAAPYRGAEYRWRCAPGLFDPRPPMELAIEAIQNARESGENELDLSEHGLTELPCELWELTHVETLQLECNWLSEIPPEIARLERLERLVLSRNRLTALPPELASLRGLRSLKADCNLLSGCPEAVCDLPGLRELALSSNRLTSLPRDIGKLSSLVVLRLDYNRLTAIPPQLGQLSNLRKLRLEHNRLNELPLELGRLEQLKDAERKLVGPDDLFGLTSDLGRGRRLVEDLRKKLEARSGLNPTAAEEF